MTFFTHLKEINEITGMRGFASQAVVVFHFFALSSLLQTSLASAIPLSWNSGVDFFFVLSGFLLMIPFLEKGNSLSLRAYFIKRAFRILPLYYLSLAGTLFFLTPQGGATSSQILASIFFLQSFNPNTFDRINGVYWTLVIEEIFYATLPIFSIFFKGNRWQIALPACIAISTFYRVVVGSIYHDNLYLDNFYLWQYPSYVEHYAIGATLANLFVSGRMRIGAHLSRRPLNALIAAIAATQLIVGSYYSVNGYNYPLVNLAFAFEYGGLIYYTLTSGPSAIIRRLFTNKASLFAGKISYSTYVWHLPIELTLVGKGLPLLIWIGLSYVAAILLAVGSYYFVERPFLRLRNRFLPLSEEKLISNRLERIPRHYSVRFPIRKSSQEGHKLSG